MELVATHLIKVKGRYSKGWDKRTLEEMVDKYMSRLRKEDLELLNINEKTKEIGVWVYTSYPYYSVETVRSFVDAYFNRGEFWSGSKTFSESGIKVIDIEVEDVIGWNTGFQIVYDEKRKNEGQTPDNTNTL